MTTSPDSTPDAEPLNTASQLAERLAEDAREMCLEEDPLKALKYIEGLYYTLEGARGELICEAHAKGASFADIGKVLYLTRQRAHQLYRGALVRRAQDITHRRLFEEFVASAKAKSQDEIPTS